MEKRIRNIDVLRGLALLVIFGRHNEVHSAQFQWLNTGMDFIKRGGVVGLEMFFVISGFLIAGLLFSEYQRYGRIDYWHFFIRRGFKIYPTYYLMISITLMLFIGLEIPFNMKSVMPFLAFLQNYLYDPSLPNAHIVGEAWGATWSLAVEEHFYICLPFLLIVISLAAKNKQTPFKSLPMVFLSVAVLCLSLRIVKSFTPFSFWKDMAASHLRADTLFFGVLIAYYYHQHRAQFQKILHFVPAAVWGGAGMLFMLPAFLYEISIYPFIYTMGISAFYIGSGLLLMAALSIDYKDHWTLNALGFIGRYSYCIYLWHFPFRMLAEYCNGVYPSGLVYLLLYAVAPILTGTLLSLWVEIPLLRFRDKVIPTRSTNAL